MPRPRLSRHDAAMLLVSLIWGANFSANKYGLGVMGPISFAAARFVLASALLWLIVRTRPAGPPMSGRILLQLLGLGVIGNSGYQLFFMTGLLTTTAINAAMIMAAMPVVVGVLATILGVDAPSPRLWTGIVIATIGVGIVVAARGIAFSGATIGGDLLIMAACLCWAIFTLGIRAVGKGLDPLRVTAVTVYGGTPLLVLGALTEQAVDWLSLSAGAWFALVYSSVFSLVLSYILWSRAVQAIGSNRTAIYNCVVPVFAAITAWIVLGERPLPVQVVGAVLVIAGVLVSQREAPAPRRDECPVALEP